MNRKLCRRGFMAASLVVGILSAPWEAFARSPGSQAKDPFEPLKRYARIRSVHVVAYAAIWLSPEADKPALRGSGEFEYWAEADRYRVRCVTARHLGLAEDAEVAFDGDKRQLFDRGSGHLSIKTGDTPRMPVALPNPLFLPLYFLNPESDKCRLCATRLTDLQDPLFWNDRTGTARPVDAAIAETASPAQYDLDGAVLLGARLSYRVVLGSVLGRLVPLKLTRFSSDGSRIEISASQFEMSRAGAGDPGRSKRPPEPRSREEGPTPADSEQGDSVESKIGPIPMRIDMTSYDDTGRKVANVAFTIDSIDLNWKADPKAFEIDEDQAKVVWDSDKHVFTKHYNPAVVNRPLLPPER